MFLLWQLSWYIFESLLNYRLGVFFLLWQFLIWVSEIPISIDNSSFSGKKISQKILQWVYQHWFNLFKYITRTWKIYLLWCFCVLLIRSMYTALNSILALIKLPFLQFIHTSIFTLNILHYANISKFYLWIN